MSPCILRIQQLNSKDELKVKDWQDAYLNHRLSSSTHLTKHGNKDTSDNSGWDITLFHLLSLHHVVQDVTSLSSKADGKQ